MKTRNQALPYYVGFSTILLVYLISTTHFNQPTIDWLHNTDWNTTVVSSAAALRLPPSGKLFCWVLTGEQYYNLRVTLSCLLSIINKCVQIPAVNSTWLKRCDHGEFFVKTALNDSSIPFSTVFKDLKNDYSQLFYKSMAAFYYAYKGISSQFDWYFKVRLGRNRRSPLLQVDDDTYVIVEHLKEFLSQFDHRKPYYLGFQFERNGRYHSGGSGYVLSNAAVKILAEKGFHNKTACPFSRYEDVGIGQ